MERHFRAGDSFLDAQGSSSFRGQCGERMATRTAKMRLTVWGFGINRCWVVKPLADDGAFNAAAEATVGDARRPALKNRATQYNAKTCR
jgi:hypothetical protein